MRCDICPLYSYWDNESDKGEACAIFGDGWDSRFQYEDKDGTIVGCYIDKHYIKKVEAERDRCYESMVQYFVEEEHDRCYGKSESGTESAHTETD